MPKRPQIPFILLEEDRLTLRKLQNEVKSRIGLKMTFSGILRLVIRLCPIDKTLYSNALQIILEDERRTAGNRGGKKKIWRMSCMVTPSEKEKLNLILSSVNSLMRSEISQCSIARLVLRTTPVSLIMLQTTREVFFDDLRRRNAKGSDSASTKAE